MSRPRVLVLPWHFEMVYFVQNGLSAADAVSVNTVLALSARAGHCQLWLQHWWQQCEDLREREQQVGSCAWLTICYGPATFCPDLVKSPVLP